MDNRDEEDRILAEMLRLANRLGRSRDELLAGQYNHLTARIEALISIRSTGAAR